MDHAGYFPIWSTDVEYVLRNGMTGRLLSIGGVFAELEVLDDAGKVIGRVYASEKTGRVDKDNPFPLDVVGQRTPVRESYLPGIYCDFLAAFHKALVDDKPPDVSAQLSAFGTELRRQANEAWMRGDLRTADRISALIGDPLPSEHELADLNARC